MKRALHDAWWRVATAPPRSFTDSLLAGALTGAAALYRAGVTMRNTAYDRGWLRQVRLDCPVISVGNLAVGGTGKTTCVAYLAAKLRRQGKRVAILSRGYGGAHPQPYWLTWEDGGLQVNGRAVATTDGLPDEPQLLASQLAGVPVLIGTRRERSGWLAREQWQVDAVVLDDALQYRRLARDCELVLVSARMPLDGWPLLPRGPMREPLSSLRRADVILMTKADQSMDRLAALTERLKTFNPRAILATAIHEPDGLWEAVTSEPVPLDRLAGSRVALLSSIGDPEGFEETVRRLGAAVVSHATYPDHYRYRVEEWQQIVQAAVSSGASAMVTTEKDLMRLRHVTRSSETVIPCWVLRIGMRFLSGEAELDARLAAVWTR